MKYFKRLLELVGKDKIKFLVGLVFAFIKNFSFMFVFFALFVGFSHINHLTSTIVFNCITILLAGVGFHFVFSYLESIIVSAQGYTMVRDFRLKSGEKLKNAPLGYYDEQKLSDIQAALTHSLSMIENYSMMLVTGTVGGFGIAIILTVALFNIHAQLGFIMIPLLILLGFILAQLYQVSLKYVPILHQKEQAMAQSIIEAVRGVSVLRTFPKQSQIKVEESIQQQLLKCFEEKRQVDIATEKAFSWRAKLFGFVVSSASIVLIMVTVYLYQTNQINFANTMVMIVGSYLIFLGLSPLVNSAFLYVRVPSNLQYIDDVLNFDTISDGNINQLQQPVDIEFNNVHFSYNSDREIIKGISFNIKQGQKVALVGPSGSGKTTIFNLLTRFWDVKSGSIHIAGQDIQNYQVEILLKNISMVFQNVYLFNDTVMNNIKFAKPQASDEEVIEICKQAQCHEFISQMKDGYQTVIGEGGATLSGGEKQRISIARSLLKDAPIILLDEATSSVDPENEVAILKAIEVLCENKTVISIAHRLNTVIHADQIIVLDDGKISEMGQHEQLLQSNGLYTRFVHSRQQAKGWRIKN